VSLTFSAAANSVVYSNVRPSSFKWIGIDSAFPLFALLPSSLTDVSYFYLITFAPDATFFPPPHLLGLAFPYTKTPFLIGLRRTHSHWEKASTYFFGVSFPPCPSPPPRLCPPLYFMSLVDCPSPDLSLDFYDLRPVPPSPRQLPFFFPAPLPICQIVPVFFFLRGLPRVFLMIPLFPPPLLPFVFCVSLLKHHLALTPYQPLHRPPMLGP